MDRTQFLYTYWIQVNVNFKTNWELLQTLQKKNLWNIVTNTVNSWSSKWNDESCWLQRRWKSLVMNTKMFINSENQHMKHLCSQSQWAKTVNSEEYSKCNRGYSKAVFSQGLNKNNFSALLMLINTFSDVYQICTDKIIFFKFHCAWNNNFHWFLKCLIF